MDQLDSLEPREHQAFQGFRDHWDLPGVRAAMGQMVTWDMMVHPGCLVPQETPVRLDCLV